MAIGDVTAYRGRDAVDANGEKIGKIDEIYEDTETGKPEWLAVKTGLFGSKVSFVPLAEASETDDGVRLPYTKDQVKDAPKADPDGGLSQEDEERLYSHYGLSYSHRPSDSGLPEGGVAAGGDGDRDADLSGTSGTYGDAGMTSAGTTGTYGDRDTERTGSTGAYGDTAATGAYGGRDAAAQTDPTPQGSPGVVGNDVSGPETDDAMTRSEEELRVDTERREAGRARLRKYVVTENVETTVPVQREELRVEREPITDANVGQAMDGPDLSEEEHEVVLHEERPVVEKDVVAKERVRLDKDVTTQEERVSEDVRKERIDLDGDTDGRL